MVIEREALSRKDYLDSHNKELLKSKEKTQYRKTRKRFGRAVLRVSGEIEER